MAAELQVLIRHIRRAAGRRELANRSDRELLTSFARDRDENAFIELVHRHAALVGGVCRRVLRHEQDVEDAFQATFLVLSRRASAIAWHESAANWLHKVALHLARKAGKMAARRQEAERNRQLLASTCSTAAPIRQVWELQEVLDKELARLPATCRSSLILCYLEGRTRDQAARLAGCSLRTLDRRLDLGRQLLRDRLARRGLDLSAVVLAAALGDSANASFAKLTSMTIQFVLQRASIKAGAACSALKLANSTLTGVSASSLKFIAGVILTAALTSAGICLMGQNVISARDPERERNATTAAIEQEKPSTTTVDLLGDPLPEGAVARLGATRFRLWYAAKIAYSPDGKILFAGNQQGVTLFDSTTGLILRQLGKELDTICWSTGVSPDGKLAAVAGLKPPFPFPNARQFQRQGANERGIIHETATGKRQCEFQAPTSHDTRIGAFSPDGTILATAAGRWQVDLYDSHTGKLLRTLEWERGPGQNGISSNFTFLDVVFMPDGKQLLASSHTTGVIRLFDVSTGKLLRLFQPSPNGIASMVLSPDGQRLAVLESAPSPDNQYFDLPGGRIRILDSQSGRRLAEIIGKGFHQTMVFANDGKTLFAGKDEKGTCVWDVSNGSNVGSVPYPYSREGLNAMALAPDGKTIARAGGPGVLVCDIVTGKERELHPGHAAGIRALALHPVDSTVVTGGADGRLLLWERRTGRLLREIMADSGQIDSATYSPDGLYLYAVVSVSFEPRHTSVRCWTSASGKELWRLDDHPVQPDNVAVSSDGKTLGVLGHTEGLLVEAATGRPIRTLDSEGERNILSSAAFTSDGTQLLAWGQFNGIHQWNVATGEHLVQTSDTSSLFGTPSAAAFSPNRKSLIVGGNDDHLILLDVATGKKIRDIKACSIDDFAHTVGGAAFSPDGRCLAWGGPHDGIIRLVDVTTGQLQQKLDASQGAGHLIVFSNDGKTVVTGSYDGTALVWDLTKVPLVKPAFKPMRP